ncbi:hypothetical protein TRIP_C20667 [Candidatus Zixiibacteriota bacterium]|nr:hypothetical protein TRIP_C20667 [candidate division Zixibacteria bacterium]
MLFRRQCISLLILIPLFLIVSCARMTKMMPSELRDMHEFLSRENPGDCRLYHYNFERQTPRLYDEHQTDSIFDIIEYIKTECGPAFNLEYTRLLLLADNGEFDDSLIGRSTIPQMLWYRGEQENLMRWKDWYYLYGTSQPVDNTHDNFSKFIDNLARKIESEPQISSTGRALGLFYSGSFDSAFSLIQSKEMRNTEIRRSYDSYVLQIKRKFPSRGHFGIFAGSWMPQGSNRILGNHPDIGIQLGSEWPKFRVDAVISGRFLSAKNNFTVDSLGHLTSTDKFNSWLFGIEGGFKVIDRAVYSADIFAGIGYDVIYSIKTAGDPEEFVSHGSLGIDLGLRQRFFLDQRTGCYIGAIVKYGIVNYSNPKGTDLSGNTLTISLVTGWSFHETLNQFLKSLNFKGNWRK